MSSKCIGRGFQQFIKYLLRILISILAAVAIAQSAGHPNIIFIFTDDHATEVVLMSVFPRGPDTENPLRKFNSEINKKVKTFADGQRVRLLDINDKFRDADGNLSKDVFPDRLYLSPAAYDIWAEALSEKIKELGI